MRFIGFLCVALALAMTPLKANADASKPIIGSYTCSQHVPCLDNADTYSSAQWSSAGNSCLTEAFGYTNPNGFFDTVAGLDGSGCLSPQYGSIPKGMGTQLVQHCCVVQRQAGACVFHCVLQ